MKKRCIKIFFIVIAILLIIFMTNVEASSMIDSIKNNINMGTDAAKTTQNFGKTIIGAIQIAGVGIAVIMLLYIAIKYMISAPSEKAEFKKTAISYSIGAVILFASSGLLQLIKTIMENLTGSLVK